MGAGDLPRRLLAIGRLPALGEPLRRVVVERVAGGDDLVLGARDVAQHRVDQPGERRGAGVEPRRLDGEIDRGVVGQVEKQDLRRRGDEDPFERSGPSRQSFEHMQRERLADRAEAAHGDHGDRARQRAVARVEPGEARIRLGGGETFVERPLKCQCVGDRLGGGEARRQTGRRLGGGGGGPRGARESNPPGRFAFNFNPAESRDRGDMNEYRPKRRPARPLDARLSRAAVTQ